MLRATRSSLLIAALAASCARDDRAVLSGSSPLVAIMNEAALELDVPAELLAALAWTETALVPPRSEEADEDGDGHVPRAFGVMGLPERSATRSTARAALLLGEPEALVKRDARTNVRASAALLRERADALYGPGTLGAGGPRDRWLAVVERVLDAGPEVALEVRRVAARGLEAADPEGRTLIIPSFEALWPSVATARRGLNAEYSGASWVSANSGNYTNDSRTAADIDVVVIHTVQGSYAGAISWFQNASANVSAHYVVRRSDGAITQMVRHEDIAWHAGNWSYNQRSIGIEHEGFVADANNYTPAMLQASADLTRWLCDNLGIPKDRSHIIGHVEVPGATHTDPGQYFPWDEYMRLVLNGSGGPPPPPMAGTGTLQGVVYIGTDSSQRIPGATVTVSPGGQTVSARASDAYWSFTLAPGMYTITAAAPGYQSATVSRAVTDGGQAWGSVGLTPATTPAGGVLKGVVFDARTADKSVRLPGAIVRMSDGSQVTARDGDAYFEISAPLGSYDVTVELSGWQATTVQRTIVDDDTWGSIGLVPVGAVPVNRPPSTPVLASPSDGATVRAARPIFTAVGLSDPDGDALSLEVEIYADEGLTTLLSAGSVDVGSEPVASWEHPVDDLPRGALVYWRARAKDAARTSDWSSSRAFALPVDGAVPGATIPWTAPLLPGVGPNTPPSAPSILDPAALAVVDTARPRVTLAAASDDDGDAVVYEVELATDDLFGAREADSGVLADPSWVVPHDLLPGSNYYLRARAADAREYGPWAPPTAFSVAVSAPGSDQPGFGVDTGAPTIDARLIPTDGGCAAARPVDGALSLALVAIAWGLRRTRRR